MNRSAALTALLTAQAKPKIAVEQTIDRGTRSGLNSAGAPLSRVRDRMTIQEQTKPEIQKPKTERQKLSDFYYGEHLRAEAAKEAEQREKDRKKAERARVEAAHRLEDQRRKEMLKENAERRDKQIEDNIIRADIKSIMQDNYDITEEVVALVKSWGTSMMKFPPAWSQAVEEVRARGAKI